MSVFMLEFALVQMTHQSPQYLKRRIDQINEMEMQLRDACSHNISVVTPADIQECQRMFRDLIFGKHGGQRGDQETVHKSH